MRLTRLKPVVGEHLEVLLGEMDCQRSARQLTLLNSVVGENLEDLHRHPSNATCGSAPTREHSMLRKYLFREKTRHHEGTMA